MSSKPRVGLIGSMQGALAGDIAPALVVSPYDGSLSGLDGVLVDGATASAAAQADTGVLRSVLESGKLLALADPSAQALEALRQLTGEGPSDPPPLLTVRRNADRPGYASTVVTPGEVSSSVASEDGVQAGPTRRIPPAPLGPALVDAVEAPPAAEPGDSVGNGLLPTTFKATFGSSGPVTLHHGPLTDDLFGPTIDNKPDDKTVKKEVKEDPDLTQTVQSLGQNSVYVLYVDGETGVPPYYIAILQQTMTFNPKYNNSPQLANVNRSRGWFALQQPMTAVPTQQNGQAFPEGTVTPLGSVPTTGSESLSYGLSLQQVKLMAISQGGENSKNFTPKLTGGLTLTGWGVENETAGGTGTWNFHMVSTTTPEGKRAGWDPTQYPPQTFPSWWKEVYPGHVITMPNAWGSISCETYTAWKFDASLIQSPRELWVRFVNTWEPWLAFLHNDEGCAGVVGHHHHLFTYTQYGKWNWLVDLGTVAKAPT